MRTPIVWVAAAFALAAAGGLTWWLTQPQEMAAPPASSANTGAILYYQDPSGAPDYSPVPKKDARGRDFVAVRAPAPAAAQQPERRVLYYRNPMGLADTSPTPKKDSMGMDYIAVYADDAPAPTGTVKISLDKVQRLGVRTATVERKALSETVMLAGTITADERKLAVVALKFPANITKLHVAATGEKVRAGQPLFEIQSQFLLKEELDLALALRNRDVYAESGDVYARSNARSLKFTRERLELYEVPRHEIERLIRTMQPTGRITWPAPINGAVLEKTAILGMQAQQGEVLYRIADLSSVWVIAEAPEMTLPIARPGATARITFNAYPGETFDGKVTFVYPEISMTTRTAKVRIELANPDGRFLPGMFASVEVSSAVPAPVLAVPDSALIDSGKRQVVLVARGEGLFEPRAVKAGRRANGFVEIAEGLKEGDRVVSSATFLIDAESNLKAALAGFTQDEATP